MYRMLSLAPSSSQYIPAAAAATYLPDLGRRNFFRLAQKFKKSHHGFLLDTTKKQTLCSSLFPWNQGFNQGQHGEWTQSSHLSLRTKCPRSTGS